MYNLDIQFSQKKFFRGIYNYFVQETLFFYFIIYKINLTLTAPSMG